MLIFLYSSKSIPDSSGVILDVFNLEGDTTEEFPNKYCMSIPNNVIIFLLNK